MDAWTFSRDFVFAYEGGFQNRPDDPGNWTGGEVGKGILKGTKYGISAASYPTLSIEALTVEDAHSIYKRDYWNANKCGEMPFKFALVTFDASVLQGVAGAAFCLQRALGTPQDGRIDSGGTAIKATLNADKDPEESALVRFFAERALSEDKILVARPSMISWAGNWEHRMFKLARIVFGKHYS